MNKGAATISLTAILASLSPGAYLLVGKRFPDDHYQFVAKLYYYHHHHHYHHKHHCHNNQHHISAKIITTILNAIVHTPNRFQVLRSSHRSIRHHSQLSARVLNKIALGYISNATVTLLHCNNVRV